MGRSTGTLAPLFLGVIILEGCTVELAEDETEVYAFKVSTKIPDLPILYCTDVLKSKIFRFVFTGTLLHFNVIRLRILPRLKIVCIKICIFLLSR